jgi:hypothetical protein
MLLAGNTVVDSNVTYLCIMIVQSTTAEVLDIGHIMQCTGFILWEGVMLLCGMLDAMSKSKGRDFSSHMHCSSKSSPFGGQVYSVYFFWHTLYYNSSLYFWESVEFLISWTTSWFAMNVYLDCYFPCRYNLKITRNYELLPASSSITCIGHYFSKTPVKHQNKL